MKQTLLIVGILVLALSALGVGVAFAQGGQPPTWRQGGYGWMHDYVEQAFATKLGLSVEQVEEQLVAGKPMYQIALDNGIQQEELANFMSEVHQEAFTRAVADGIVTQERADWMLPRMQSMYQDGYGPGNCPMHNGQGGMFQPGRGMGPGMMGGGYAPGWGQNP